MLFRVVIILIVTRFVSNSSNQKDIVEELKERYYDQSMVCFDDQNKTQPMYKCSGIMIRGVRRNTDENTFFWRLKPQDKIRNSFSFGFLRKDFQFSYLGRGYDAGFIIYPHLSAPIGKTTQKVLCGFPTDGHTDLRYYRGCGMMRNDIYGTSLPCDVQNTRTFTHWLWHYNQIVRSSDPRFELRQCGFDLSGNTAVQNFDVVRKASLYINRYSPTRAYKNSELKLEGWDDNNAEQIPIQAFFYFMGTERGYENALKYQSDFYTQSGGEMVPIVGIRLPSRERDIQIHHPNKIHHPGRNVKLDIQQCYLICLEYIGFCRIQFNTVFTYCVVINLDDELFGFNNFGRN